MVKTEDLPSFWEKIKSGDEMAFQKIYDDYADLLYGYGMKIVANETLVANTIQSLFIYIFEKRRSLSVPKNLTSYLCVSFRRMLLNDLKKQRSNHTIVKTINEGKGDDYNFELEVDAQEAMINQEVTSEMVMLLQKELNSMSAKQREVIYLRYYHNMGIDEISDILNLKVQTVRNLSTLALNSLRSKMQLGFITFVVMLALVMKKILI